MSLSARQCMSKLQVCNTVKASAVTMLSKKQLTQLLRQQQRLRIVAGSARRRNGRPSMTCWKADARCANVCAFPQCRDSAVCIKCVRWQALHMHQLARTKVEEEERIAAVLQQRKLSSERSAKELQQLRNESAELRDLQASCCSLKLYLSGMLSC